jgi:hypothetical protein
MLPVSHDEARDGGQAGVAHGSQEEAVDALRALAWTQVEGPLEVDRIDLAERHEDFDPDRVIAVDPGGLEVLVRHVHELVVDLERLYDLLVRYRFAFETADLLVRDPAAVLGMHVVEAEIAFLDGRIDANGHV